MSQCRRPDMNKAKWPSLLLAVLSVSSLCLRSSLAAVIWRPVGNCTDEQKQLALDNTEMESDTIGFTSEEPLCVPTDRQEEIDSTNTTSTRRYTLSPRETFYVEISDFTGDVDVGSAGDFGGLGDLCVLEVEDRTFVQFSDVSETQLYLRVGSNTTHIPFYTRGFHLAGPTIPPPLTYIYPEQPQLLAVYPLDEHGIIQHIQVLELSLCKVEGNNNTKVEVRFTRAPDIYCKTFPKLEDSALVYGVLVDDGIDSVFGDDENVEVFVTNRSCNYPGVRETAEVITLSRVTGTTTPTSPSPDPSTTPTRGSGGDGGLSGGEIAGVVIGCLILILILIGFAIAVIIAVPRFKSWKNKRNRGRGDHEMGPTTSNGTDGGEGATQVVLDREAEGYYVYVWNLGLDDDEIVELLAEANRGVIPDIAKSDTHRLISLLLDESCKNFYLVHRESREELISTNLVAWKLLRDLNNLTFPREALQKFIDVRVYDEEEINGLMDEVPGPFLTVNLSLQKWKENSKERAVWIQSKARANKNEPDGRFPSETSSPTDSPPRHTPGQLTVLELAQYSAPPVNQDHNGTARPPSEPTAEQPPSYSTAAGPETRPLITENLETQILSKLNEVHMHTKKLAEDHEEDSAMFSEILARVNQNSSPGKDALDGT